MVSKPLNWLTDCLVLTCLSFSLAASERNLLASARPVFAFPTLMSIGGVCSKKCSSLASPPRKFAKHSKKNV